MLVTWDTGSTYTRTNRSSLSWQTWRTSEKLYKWYDDRVERGESRKPTEPATGEMIFPGPRFPQKSKGEGQFFSSIATKNANSVSPQAIKDNLNSAPKVFQTTKTNGPYAKISAILDYRVRHLESSFASFATTRSRSTCTCTSIKILVKRDHFTYYCLGSQGGKLWVVMRLLGPVAGRKVCRNTAEITENDWSVVLNRRLQVSTFSPNHWS